MEQQVHTLTLAIALGTTIGGQGVGQFHGTIDVELGRELSETHIGEIFTYTRGIRTLTPAIIGEFGFGRVEIVGERALGILYLKGGVGKLGQNHYGTWRADVGKHRTRGLDGLTLQTVDFGGLTGIVEKQLHVLGLGCCHLGLTALSAVVGQ